MMLMLRKLYCKGKNIIDKINTSYSYDYIVSKINSNMNTNCIKD